MFGVSVHTNCDSKTDSVQLSAAHHVENQNARDKAIEDVGETLKA